MKYLIIDDEHELYKIMYADLLDQCTEYDVQEIPKFSNMRGILKKINQLHFDDRINRHIWLPLKKIWNSFYYLDSFQFDLNEQYWIVFLNGTLRNFYSKRYLEKFKKEHKNVKLALIMYDSTSNPFAQRAVKMFACFDRIFSFDKKDCQEFGFEYIYSTLSFPKFVKEDPKYKSSVFFVGSAIGRLDTLNKCMNKIINEVKNTSFYVTGVQESEQKLPIIYNQTISYREALQRSYNTNCILEIVKPGQTGISLRTCEAIMFNKKLLTNNKSIVNMPFYNKKYISVFDDISDLDIKFITSKIDVDYKYTDYFSPVNILKMLEREKV